MTPKGILSSVNGEAGSMSILNVILMKINYSVIADVK